MTHYYPTKIDWIRVKYLTVAEFMQETLNKKKRQDLEKKTFPLSISMVHLNTTCNFIISCQQPTNWMMRVVNQISPLNKCRGRPAMFNRYRHQNGINVDSMVSIYCQKIIWTVYLLHSTRKKT